MIHIYHMNIHIHIHVNEKTENVRTNVSQYKRYVKYLYFKSNNLEK